MAGYKTFYNNTDKQLDITIYVREGADPAHTAGTKEFSIHPFQSVGVEYGNSVNIYLNGFNLIAMYEGQIFAQQEFVVTRGSHFDDLLNRNCKVYIEYKNDTFMVTSSN